MKTSMREWRVLHEERGGVLVMVALYMPVLILIGTFVVDVANWFEHKRHLQLQADAGALAAAGDVICPGSDAQIEQTARDYSGSLYNAQVSGRQPSVNFRFNKKTYFNQSSPADDTIEAPTCTSGMIDVKLTETDLPLFLRAADLFTSVPFINAHARVSIKKIQRATGALPVGVPDVNPKSARVEFVDESTDTVIGSRALQRTGPNGGMEIWDNSAAPLPVKIDAQNIGLRVILGGATSTACGDPLVECYDLGSQDGVVHVRGWSAAGSGAQPAAPKDRSVTLVGGSCADPYFSGSSATCTIGVRAKVDFGTSDPTTVGAKLTARVDGADYQLAHDPASDTWESPSTIPVAPNAGPMPVELRWEETIGKVGGDSCKVGGGNKCKGSFGTVQRAFSATASRSGPIKLAQIFEGASFGVNSLERCSAVQTSCTHDLVVKIGVIGKLENASAVDDPVVALRVTGGSLNQSLDCDPAVSKLKDELAAGCTPKYEINAGTACPGTPNALWGTTQPWQCVAVQTGSATNQVPAGMNKRVFGDEQATSCTSPNNWSSFPDLPKDDPRIIQVFLTPFGAFSGSGSTTVPVTNFATFYATGWSGSGGGFANPCEGQGDDPAPDGHIVGHFIKYVQSLNDGDNGDEVCDFSAFGTCVAVLTE